MRKRWLVWLLLPYLSTPSPSPNSPPIQGQDKHSLHSFRTSAETFHSGMLFPNLKITSLSNMHSSPTENIQAIASLTCQCYPPWFITRYTCRLYPAGHWCERQEPAASRMEQSHTDRQCIHWTMFWRKERVSQAFGVLRTAARFLTNKNTEFIVKCEFQTNNE